MIPIGYLIKLQGIGTGSGKSSEDTCCVGLSLMLYKLNEDGLSSGDFSLRRCILLIVKLLRASLEMTAYFDLMIVGRKPAVTIFQ